MLIHLVFFSFPNTQAAEAGLAGLKPLETIPAARMLRILPNHRLDAHGDPAAGHAVDLVVFGVFENALALARYQADPVYQQAVRTVRPIRDLRLAAAVEVEPEALIAALSP